MTAAVRHVLKQIASLSDKERSVLQRELVRMEERQWKTATAAMRKLAKARGITQKTIDDAVMSVRYGR